MHFDDVNSDGCLDLIATIANVSSTTDKLYLMRDDLKPVLWWTYNPDITFGLRKIYTTGVGKQLFNHQTQRLLTVLSTRKLSGRMAEDTVATYTRTLTRKSGELFSMMILRDLRCGIGVGLINTKFPGLIPVYEYMKPMDYDPSKLMFPVYVGTKKNGIRAFWEDGKFTTRKGKKIWGMEHITKELQQNGILHRLDGELVVPSRTFEKGTGMIRSHDSTPQAFFWVWDIPHLRQPYYIRRHKIEQLLSLTATCRWLPDYEVHSLKEIDDFYRGCLSRGEEGIVVKTFKHFYQIGESWDWMKRKEILTLDLEVVDVYEGKGQFEGSLGGIIVRYDAGNRASKRIRVGSGFTPEQRHRYYSDPGTILGRLAEILFKERTPLGKLRDPRFVGLRWDK